jgi:hypothetical protein
MIDAANNRMLMSCENVNPSTNAGSSLRYSIKNLNTE